MAHLLIRMRLAMLRHQPGGWWGWKAWIGLVFALMLLWTVASSTTDPVIITSVVALLLALWTIGMVMLSLQSGGDVTDLLPEHFASLPIQPQRLALGLLAAAFIRPGTLLLLVAALALPLTGVRLSASAALMSIPIVMLHVVMVLLVMRVLLSVASMTLRTRIGVELVALQYALLISLSSVGWVLLGRLSGTDALSGWLRGEMPEAAAPAWRLLPTGWGAVAIGAVAEHHWWLAVGALLALVVINALLLVAWSQILHRQMSDRPSSSKERWSGPIDALRSPMQAAVWREVLRWFREPRSAIELRVAVLSAMFIACLPLFTGWDGLLPFMGALVVVMAALTASNIYGLEGTSLWLTLMTPGAERIDVRAKQWAFVLLFGPTAVVASVIPTLVTGQHWAWPWLWAFVPGALGIAGGVMILISVAGAVPVPDAARRNGNLMASGDTTGPAYLTLLLVLVLALPSLAVTGIGVRDSNALLQIAGVVLGWGTGGITFWWGGERAIRRLETEGPELLSLLRHGPATAEATVAESPSDHLRPLAQAGVGLCWTLAMIAIFPQALVPMVFKLTGQDATVWFVPLYTPEPWQWPAIAGMVLIGGMFIAAAVAITRRYADLDELPGS